jgi:peptidoglycan/LPS O-acetylase OafA/YrhL
MQKDRDLSFDAFRGIAIIAVVAIHAAYQAFPVKFVPNGQWNFFFLVAYCQFLTFSVPAFFFISGYWISKKPVQSWQDYRIFLIRRLARILVPYFFWSFVLLGYAAVRSHQINIYQVIFKLMTGRAAVPYYTYYFIVVLAQLCVLTPLLHYINRRPYGLTFIIVLNVISLLVLYLSRMKVIWHHPVTLPFYLWIVFYEMGLLVGMRANGVFPPKKLRSLILPGILISILVSEVEGFTILSGLNDPFFAATITKYSSFLYSVFVILGFLVLRERIRRWPGFLVTLGRYSFGIYLIHLIFLTRVVEYVRTINIIYLFQPLYQFIVISLTLLICFIFITVARKLLPESFCVKVLGF